MIKRGFTLAEVLITLGIIGVISAMTVPTFVSNAENKANAAKLSSLITDVQNAFTNMITSEAVLDMEETEFGQESNSSATTATRAGKLSKYLKLSGSASGLGSYYSENIAHIAGSDAHPSSSSNDTYQLKNGALVIYEISRLTGSSSVVDGALGYISIDVNGGAKPNLWGRDVFKFILGNDGILYPAGGTDYNEVTNCSSSSSSSCPQCNIGTDTIGCTNTLIQDGFKVNY